MNRSAIQNSCQDILIAPLSVKLSRCNSTVSFRWAAHAIGNTQNKVRELEL